MAGRLLTIDTVTLSEASALLEKKEVSAVELVDAAHAHSMEKDGTVHAYIELYDDVREQAQAADARRGRGEAASALLGIPLAIKDNILIERRRVSAGSRMLAEYVAPYSATVSERLHKAGAVFLGRTNMDEFAMGSSTEHSAFGVTKNPHDLTRVPGGSSGGSAAAVAMGGALGALGSDTGGSIRQPSALCGVVGLKPTYGRVSRYGLIAMGSSLDQIGPMTKTVADAKFLFNAIQGHDPLDGTSLTAEFVATEQARAIKNKRIGVPRHLMEAGVDPDVLEQFEKQLTKLKDAGWEIVDIKLPNAGHSLAVYYIIMPAEASTNLARFDGMRYGTRIAGADGIDEYGATRGALFGKEVRRRILLGTYVLSAGYYDAYYRRAQKLRSRIARDFQNVFYGDAADAVRIIATPTTPSPAFKIGEKTDDPVQMYLEDIFTVPANIAGVPALSVPAGSVERDGRALPVGVQFTAAWCDEDALFAVGEDVESHSE